MRVAGAWELQWFTKTSLCYNNVTHLFGVSDTEPGAFCGAVKFYKTD